MGKKQNKAKKKKKIGDWDKYEKEVKFCIVLYCIVLYCIVLYCIVSYCIVLNCIVWYKLGAVYDFALDLKNASPRPTWVKNNKTQKKSVIGINMRKKLSSAVLLSTDIILNVSAASCLYINLRWDN